MAKRRPSGDGMVRKRDDGRREARNIYAQTEAECEEKLAQLITEMKAEIAALRARKKVG